MSDEYTRYNLGTVGEIRDERIERQFQEALRKVIQSITSTEAERDSTGNAKGTVTITMAFEGKDEEEMGGAPISVGVQVNYKTPKLKAGASFMHYVGNEYLVPVIDNDDGQVRFSVAKGGGK